MDTERYLEKNRCALLRHNPALAAQFAAADTTQKHYVFELSRTGKIVPAMTDTTGTLRALHSLVDPEREARRLVQDSDGEGYFIVLGLGGGFVPAAILERNEGKDIYAVLVIDYDVRQVTELLCVKDYTGMFGDPRFRLIVDAEPAFIERTILDTYQPALSGGIRVLPLRTRTTVEPARFNQAGAAIQRAIDTVRGDYSVQTFLGKRWFSNTIRNMLCVAMQDHQPRPVQRVSICAAGPSLDQQLPSLVARRAERFVIAVDTSLPAVLSAGISPDAVISIDAQHISYQHFMSGLPPSTLLYLDLASPPIVASQAAHPHFFAGSHPLTRYLSQYWRPLPELDSSGGNVTYAALSLAEYLCAESIELLGADFAYPYGHTYAKGTYLFSLFADRQSRFMPVESSVSALLYRTPSLTKIMRDERWYYETTMLAGYRQRLEQKICTMDIPVIRCAGDGAPLSLPEMHRGSSARYKPRTAYPVTMSAEDFLGGYREQLRTLNPTHNQPILATILPTASALQKEMPELYGPRLIEATVAYCIQVLDKVL